MLLKGERTLNAISKENQRRELQTRVLAHGPRAVYCGLLVIQQRRNYSSKFALAVFKGLYGTWPRSCDRGEPAELPEIGLLEEWLAARKKRFFKRRAAKPAPLVEQMKKPVVVNEAGFVEGTLMTEEDFNEGFR